MDKEQKQMVEELLSGFKKSTGVAREYFFGNIDSDKNFSYPNLSDSERQTIEGYLAEVQHFTDTKIDPDWIDRHSEIPESVISGLANLGVLGVSVPKEFGGLGMSQHTYCKTVEIIAAKCSSTALFINAHQSVGLKALLLFGTEEQKKRWLRPLARGEEIAAFSLTEPNAGSDAGGIETRAVFDPKKNVYRINGKKQWTTNGSLAHVLTVMAKTEIDGPNGKVDKITAFLVTPDMPGFRVTAKALDKVGMRGSRTSNLEFQNMEVPSENILGPIGGGLKVCLTVLDYGRTTFGAMCTGAAKFLKSSMITQAQNRYQFKQPLAAFGMVKKKIARSSALTYAMDATTYMTADLIDKGQGDIMLESAMLKVFVSEALWQILYDTMQIYGGRSFFTDHPFERMMRDARLNMIGEGSNEVMRAFIASVGMRDVGLHLKGVLEAAHNPLRNRKILWRYFKDRLSKWKAPKIKIRSSKLKEEVESFSLAVKKFGKAVVAVLKNYREDVVDKQFELERIADSAIALYTVSAVISKLDASFVAAHQFIVPQQEIESGKLYCQMAFSYLDSSLDALFSKQDKAFEHLSDQLTGLERSDSEDEE